MLSPRGQRRRFFDENLKKLTHSLTLSFMLPLPPRLFLQISNRRTKYNERGVAAVAAAAATFCLNASAIAAAEIAAAAAAVTAATAPAALVRQ